MKDSNVVEVELRKPASGNMARRLRAEGKLPAILYGGNRKAQAIVVNPRHLVQTLKSESGQNTILKLQLPGSGGSQTAMVYDYQVDTLTHRLLHADFMRISMDEAIEVDVPVEVVGEPRGVQVDRGVLDLVLREIHVKCLPGEIPDSFQLDVEDLEIGDVIHVGDLQVPSGVELLTDPESTLVSIAAPRIEEELEPEPEDILDAVVEPELIRADRQEGEDDEETKEGQD